MRRHRQRHRRLPHSSSASRCTAGAAVFELEPVAGAAGAVARAQPLRHDAFDVELADVPSRKEPTSMLSVGSSWQSGGGMNSLTIISALLGVWLGLTFRVLILVPAAILALATLAGGGAASEAGALWMMVLDTSVIAAMQAGYIAGSALFVAVADEPARERSCLAG
jgi:hypothetical protein